MKKRWIGNTFFGMICLALVFVILAQIGILPFRFVVIQSGSMRPEIEPGDLVVIQVDHHLTPTPGDIVYFPLDGSYIVHRVIAIGPTGIETKGDANQGKDASPIQKVDGIMLFAVPKLGYAVDFIQQGMQGLVQLITGTP